MGRACLRRQVKARGERRIRGNEERFLTSEAGAFVPQNHPGRKRGAGGKEDAGLKPGATLGRAKARGAAAMALEPRPCLGLSFTPILGVRTAEVFTVSLSWVRPKANGGRPGHVSHPRQLPPVSTRSLVVS